MGDLWYFCQEEILFSFPFIFREIINQLISLVACNIPPVAQHVPEGVTGLGSGSLVQGVIAGRPVPLDNEVEDSQTGNTQTQED